LHRALAAGEPVDEIVDRLVRGCPYGCVFVLGDTRDLEEMADSDRPSTLGSDKRGSSSHRGKNTGGCPSGSMPRRKPGGGGALGLGWTGWVTISSEEMAT
jgi:hypothetical protein